MLLFSFYLKFFHQEYLSTFLISFLLFWQLTRAYFAFLEVLFSSHIVFILNLDTNTFRHIVGSLESGLKGLDTNISSQVCFMSLLRMGLFCSLFATSIVFHFKIC